MIRVMLVEDHASSREPLAFMIEQEPDMTVVAQAGTLAQAREGLAVVAPILDYAIVDLELPDGEGADVIRGLRAANRRIQALVLSAYTDLDHVSLAVEAGAAGVVHKTARIAEVIGAIRRLEAGEPLLSAAEMVELCRVGRDRRRAREEAATMLAKLTPREMEVLRALAEGLSDKQIAERLYVGDGTVRSHLVNVFAKLEVASRLEAVLFAIRHSAVEVGEPS
jgi:DNA-binding NarL/FixJ family response regulator